MKSVLRSFVPALVGGLAVAAVLLALGFRRDGPATRTVVEQAPIGARPAASESRGLTVHQIYGRAAPGVAFIRAQIVRDVPSPFGLGPERQQGQATGSGFVLDRAGHILTNAHVVAGASTVTVQLAGRQENATIVGRDDSTDIALLKVDPAGLRLRPLTLGESRSAQVGDPVIAIGNPFGLDRTLTTGVVSALQRHLQAPNGFSIDHVIQTDAAINPGNSGGPLLDAAGRVIGINSQIATGGTGSGGNIGIGFAVPIDTAKRVIPQLERSGRVEHAYLGIEGVSIDSSLASLNLRARSGILVQRVTPRGPAARAGLRGGDTPAQVNGQTIQLGGDVIQAIDGRDVRSIEQVVGIVDRHRPGDTVALRILRGGRTLTIRVTLGNRPARAPQG